MAVGNQRLEVSPASLRAKTNPQFANAYGHT